MMLMKDSDTMHRETEALLVLTLHLGIDLDHQEDLGLQTQHDPLKDLDLQIDLNLQTDMGLRVQFDLE
jgi:hypothetical protein